MNTDPYKTKNSKRDSLFILILLQLPLVSLAFARFLPVSNGWFLAWADRGRLQTPYKDFYLPIPPVGLFVLGRLPLLFSDPLLAEQIVNVIVWLMLVVSIYLILQIIVTKRVALVATTVATSLYFSQPYNIIAGYFELALGLLFLGSFLLLRDLLEDDADYKFNWLWIAGSLLTLSILTKQSFVIPAVMILVPWLWLHKNQKQKFRLVLVGASAPVVTVLVWAQYHGMLSRMVTQLAGGGGKGVESFSIVKKIWEWGVVPSFTASSIIPWLIFFGILGIRNYLTKNNNLMVSQVQILLLLVFSYRLLYTLFAGEKIVGLALVLHLLLLLCFLSLVTNFKIDFLPVDSLSCKDIGISFYIFALVISLIWPIISDPSGWTIVRVGENISASLIVGSFVLVIWLAFGIRGSHSFSAFKAAMHCRSFQLILFMVIIGVPVASTLSGQLTIESWILPCSVLLALMVQMTMDERYRVSGRMPIFMVLCLILFSSSSRTVMNPYTWWGLNEQPISAPGQKVQVDALRNFRISTEMGRYYQTIENLVNASAAAKGSGNQLKIYYGIQNQGLSILLQKRPIHTRCVIMWWDVCPPNEMKQSVADVVSTRPDLIIWNNPPEEVQRGHEIAFNGGRPGHLRDLQKWIDEQVTQGKYKVVQIVSIPGTETWKTEVIAKNNQEFFNFSSNLSLEVPSSSRENNN